MPQARCIYLYAKLSYNICPKLRAERLLPDQAKSLSVRNTLLQHENQGNNCLRSGACVPQEYSAALFFRSRYRRAKTLSRLFLSACQHCGKRTCRQMTLRAFLQQEHRCRRLPSPRNENVWRRCRVRAQQGLLLACPPASVLMRR